MSTPAPRPPQPQEALFQMITGSFVSQAVGAAARLGLPDHLAAGPRTADELAAAAGAHAPSVFRLVRALASIGVFAEPEPGRFALTPVGELLQSDRAGSLKPLAIWLSEPEHRAAWSNLIHAVKTGEPAFDATFGQPVFEYFRDHADFGEVFNAAMTSMSRQLHAAAVSAYDFTGIGTLVDVGGGHGALIASVLAANPSMRGVLFDLPHVVSGAAGLLEVAGVADRCRIESGSFFETVPTGGDAYIMSMILHDWDDQRSTTILRNIRGAMSAGGRLLLNEQVIPPGTDPGPGKWLDLEMLVMTPGGRERTESEWAALLEGAGFRLSRIVPTQSPTSVIEGMPA